MLETFLFGIFPYMAISIALVGSIWRYATNQFTFSSISSQFLEGRQLFWGSVLWHYGIIIILTGHLIGVIIPSWVKAFNGVPVRLYILEGTAFALALLLFAGLILLIFRRTTNSFVRTVTSRMDIVLLLFLLLQVITGISIAIFHRWGSGWYVETATPYLWSLAKFAPKIEYMESLPLLLKIHAVDAFVLVALFPFTRLVHMVSIPFAYLWRPYQVVMWNSRRLRQ